jgi:hypothetical protein
MIKGYDYREVMRQFYAEITEFISQNPRLLEELTYEECFFSYSGLSEEEKKSLRWIGIFLITKVKF